MDLQRQHPNFESAIAWSNAPTTTSSTPAINCRPTRRVIFLDKTSKEYDITTFVIGRGCQYSGVFASLVLHEESDSSKRWPSYCCCCGLFCHHPKFWLEYGGYPAPKQHVVVAFCRRNAPLWSLWSRFIQKPEVQPCNLYWSSPMRVPRNNPSRCYWCTAKVPMVQPVWFVWIEPLIMDWKFWLVPWYSSR